MDPSFRPRSRSPLSSSKGAPLSHPLPAAEPIASPAPLSPGMPAPQPLHEQPAGLTPAKRGGKKRHSIQVIGAVVALIVIVVAAVIGWYLYNLQPLGKDTNQYIKVTISKGMTPAEIGTLLQKSHLIRSAQAFDLYTRFSHTRGSLQYGNYRLTPSNSTPQIVSHLSHGDVDTFSLTFLPGGTVADAEAVLKDAGYSQSQIQSAFSASYTTANGIVFTDKPASASLEGYIYGDTYNFSVGTDVPTILQTIFDEYSKVVQDNNLISLYQSHGLNLYQGITLASIIQREMGSSADPNVPSSDQKQVAQVFYLRLADNMPLGSDVTYQYAAKIMGVTPSPSLDSPYNTRLYPGLPPGPIATPGKGALLATAQPAPGNYLYFLSGDDGKTYFSTTAAQHQANIQAHCQVKCSQEP